MDLFNGAPRSFVGSTQINYQHSYKRRLRDRMILHEITNSKHKGDFYKKGTTIRIPVPGRVIIRDTQPGGGIIYQKPKDTYEDFTIGRESYWGLEFTPEDTSFMPWDPRSEYFTNATDEMAEHIERKFGRDIINKCHPRNTGNQAGARTGGFVLGAVGDGNAVTLYKTQAQVDGATGVTYRNVAADYFVHGINCLKEQKGAKGEEFFAIAPTIVCDYIQTSELKMAGWMAERNSTLRTDVSMIGKLGGATIIQDDVLLPIFKNTTNGKNVYPILFMSKNAISFVDEVVFRDSNMKDIGSWDEYHRCKSVYDWFVLFPEFFGVGYVELAAPTVA